MKEVSANAFEYLGEEKTNHNDEYIGDIVRLEGYRYDTEMCSCVLVISNVMQEVPLQLVDKNNKCYYSFITGEFYHEYDSEYTNVGELYVRRLRKKTYNSAIEDEIVASQKRYQKSLGTRNEH